MPSPRRPLVCGRPPAHSDWGAGLVVTREASIESLHDRLDAFEQHILEELRALRGQAPATALYCPVETVETYAERKGGTVGAAAGRVLCPGGFLLQVSRSNVKPDARQAADDFFHALPAGTSFTATYAEGQRFTMRHHNVWRSSALTYEQARALELPGLRLVDSSPAGQTPDQPPAVITPAALPGGAQPAATAEATSTSEAVGRLLTWARQRWGHELSDADVMRAAGPGDWDSILARHDGQWKAVARTVGRVLAERASVSASRREGPAVV